MNLREVIAALIEDALERHGVTSFEETLDDADAILSIPRLKEALDFYEACQSAFEVNGEFKVTKEALRGKGGVSASL